jgi:uncharacterized repeat protein (TIGR03803 family)
LGCGTVFRLTPPATVCRSVSCPWTETVLYRFGHLVGDGINPFSSLAFDHGGNLYGTTNGGGAAQLGTVYELAHAVNGWNESILYSFNSIATGYGPEAEVTFDQAGNLYGTTPFGGQGCSGGGCGLVYKLSQSGSGWVETVLYQFSGGFDGSQPYGGLIFDTAGNIYGTTVYGGLHNPGGTVFELMPSNGGWNFSSIYSLYGNSGSVATLALDGAETLYGTATGDPFGTGSIFQLLNSGGSWTFTTLHTFDGHDGVTPYGSVLVDSSGNLFGTASEGGTGACRFGCGVVWQITP